jgi:hypothetical protein
MNTECLQLVENLNNDDINIRLDSLKKLMKKIETGEIEKPKRGNDVNNHIHTTYSFSPYSPTKAVWMAYNAGLATAGIMDHDSISGAEEFIEAGKIAGIATTIGMECRVDFSKTPLNGKRVNNPDQNSIVYMALHGIPHTQIEKVKAFFAPFSEQRNVRNRQMVDKINSLVKPLNIEVNFETDVVPLSKSTEGGSITERHLLYALSLKLIEAYGKGVSLLSVLKDKLNLNTSSKIEKLLLDQNNPFYAYDLLGLLKGELVSQIYIDACAECPDVKDVIALSNSIGSISAYAYLGDVGDSVTGDKKTQKFEDDYLDLLFDVIKDIGFNSVTYMLSRNTKAQLDRIRELCDIYGFFQISGEDINSPRQSFICEAMKDSSFQNLVDAAWALIGHETESTIDIGMGMFSPNIVSKYPTLEERKDVYKVKSALRI